MMNEHHTRRPDLRNRLTEIADSELADVCDGLIQDSLDNYDLAYEPIEGFFADYFQHDKTLGAVQEEQLVTVGMICIAYVRSPDVSTNFKVAALELGASSITEAAFVRTVAEHAYADTVDERLQDIDVAESMLDAACKMIGDESTVTYHRLDIKRSFSNIQRDIVCGELSVQSVDEIRQRLTNHLDEAHTIESLTERAGVVGEIRTLLHYWNQYDKPGQHVAIPATVRGDNGKFNKADTHDIDIIRQKNDRNWIVSSQLEVKNQELTKAMLSRYTGVNLATFDDDGNVRISGEHRSNSDLGQSA